MSPLRTFRAAGLVELRLPQPGADARRLGLRAADELLAEIRAEPSSAPRASVRNFSISKTRPPRPTRSPR
jgi:hypothetical protein